MAVTEERLIEITVMIFQCFRPTEIQQHLLWVGVQSNTIIVYH